MEDKSKTRQELIDELNALRKQLGSVKQQVGITATGKAEEPLRVTDQFMDMVEHSPIAMALNNRKGTIEYLNAKFIRTFGYTLDDIPTLEDWWVRAYPDSAYRQHVMDTWNNAVEKAIKEGGPIQAIPYNVTCKNGETRIAEIFGAPIGDKNLVILEDITERRKTEEALKESEAKFRLFMEYSPVYVFFKDENGRSLHLSRNFEQMLGRPVNELLGKSMDELFPPEFAEKMTEDDLRILREGKSLEVEEEFGGRFFSTIKFPIYIEGKPRFLAGFTMDITERRQMEQERASLIAELREALENIRTLRGIIPICASCKKIRTDEGYWQQVEVYIKNHSEAEFTHGVCPDCVKKLYPGLYDKGKG